MARAVIKTGTGAASPTEQLTELSAAETTVTDAKGRAITLRKPSVVAQYRLVKVIGEDASNQVYMSMVAPLIFVAAIDGDPVPFPRSNAELEALIQRLDEHGLEVVMKGVAETWGQVDQDEARDQVKK